MKQKALHDFAHNDYRLHGKLLVRLNFVRSWSPRRTLAYYKAVRRLVDILDDKIHTVGYFDADGNRANPFAPEATDMNAPRKVYTYKKFVSAEYDHPQFVSDFNELVRYKKALQWICSQKENVPIQQRCKRHPESYYVR